MSTITQSKSDNRIFWIVAVLSVTVPLLVAVLMFLPQTGKLGDFNVSFLPGLNAIINSATAICLITGYYFIKKKNQKMHKTMMLSAFFLSAIFLISYVTYHFQAAPTKFGGEGTLKGVYYLILLTHILLAAAVVPLVLLSIYFGLSDKIILHKKITKWSFPIWLYVAVTGVLVYLMISPYYIS